MECSALFPYIQVLYVRVGKRVTLCCKPAVYGTIPPLCELIQRAPYDVITLEPSDDVREDPFVPPDVFAMGTLEWPTQDVGQYLMI